MTHGREHVRVVPPGERAPAPATPGMDRRTALATEGVWAGTVRTEPGIVSGWHHHGEYETVVYVLTGSVKVESGPGGSEAVEAGPGDFVFIPGSLVHRESNPSSVPADLVVVRAGQGESTFNVDGPDRS